MWTAKKLAENVVEVLQGVLVHQATRWGPLLGNWRGFEGWWKAEFVTALQAWCWTYELPRDFWVVAEAKPRDYNLGDTGQAPDILVAPWSDENNCMDYESGPRVWIEIKERGTWWNNAAKGYGEGNHGLRHDLAKWDESTWSPQDDIVLVCQITAHESEWTRAMEPFPKDWIDVLEDIATTHPRYVPSRTVAYPCWGDPTQHGSARWVRWARMDFFTIHAPALE